MVYSGKGIAVNITPTDTDTVPGFYPRANPNPSLANSNPPLFDMASWRPDVIIQAYGVIDYMMKVDSAAFRTAHHDFIVNTLRARAPSAHIFMVVLEPVGAEDIAKFSQEIVAERQAAGDTKVHLYVPKPPTEQEARACMMHTTPEYHRRIATELAAEIKSKVGW